jgi:hypothetical protein
MQGSHRLNRRRESLFAATQPTPGMTASGAQPQFGTCWVRVRCAPNRPFRLAFDLKEVDD